MSQKIQSAVENIVLKSKESAAFATFSGDRIETPFSKSEENSISIIPAGQILHFEDDHAAALAIFGNLTEEKRDKCLNSEFSRIKNQNALEEELKIFGREKDGFTYFLDESREREGISRLAVPLIINNNPCALFICAPTVRIKNHLPEFLSILQEGSAYLLYPGESG